MTIRLTSDPAKWGTFVKESLFIARTTTKMEPLAPSDVEILKGHLAEDMSPAIFAMFVAKYDLNESDNHTSWKDVVSASGYAENTAKDKMQRAMDNLRVSLKHAHPVEMAAMAKRMKGTGSSSRHISFFLEETEDDLARVATKRHFLRDCLPNCSKQKPCPSCLAQRLLVDAGLSVNEITTLTEMLTEFQNAG